MSKKSSTFAPAFEKRTKYPFVQKAVSLAQLVEQLTLNQWVEGSSPSGDTKEKTETDKHNLSVSFSFFLFLPPDWQLNFYSLI